MEKLKGMLTKVFKSKKLIIGIILFGTIIVFAGGGYYLWQKRIPQKTAMVLKNIVHNLFFEKHHPGDIYGVVHIEEHGEEIELSELELPEEEKEGRGKDRKGTQKIRKEKGKDCKSSKT